MNEFIYELWLQDKLLIIGLFQICLIIIMFAIVNMNRMNRLHLKSQNGNQPIGIKSPENDSNLSEEINPVITLMNNPTDHKLPNIPLEVPLEVPLPDAKLSEKIQPLHCVDSAYKVEISLDLLSELLEISNDPTATVDEAIRWWLRRRNVLTFELDIDRDRQYQVGSRSKRSPQDLWND